MAQIRWAQDVNGDFAKGVNWRGDVVPGSGDDAVLDAAGGKAYTATSSANETVAGVQTATDARLLINGGDFTATNATDGGANAGAILVDNGATLTIGGTVDNTGAITIIGSGLSQFTDLHVSSGGVTLTGGGNVTFNNSNSEHSDETGGVLTNLDNVMSGDITVETYGFVNDALGIVIGSANSHGISCNTVQNAGLLKSSASQFVISGTSEITNTGTIFSEGKGVGITVFSQILDQSGGGILRAASGSSVSLTVHTLVGGVLDTTGTGTIVIGRVAAGPPNPANYPLFDGTISAITVDGAVEVPDRFLLTIQGAITNSGVLTLETGADRTSLIVGAPGVTLSGAGSVVMTDSHAFLNGASSSATLTNVANTISGAGQLGNGSMGLVNEAAGVIDATGAHELDVDLGSNMATNAGLMEATGGGRLILKDTTVEDSTGGRILAAAGSVAGLEGASVIGGTIATTGSGVVRTFAGSNLIDGTTSAVTDSALLIVADGTGLTLQGAIANSGRIKLLSSGEATMLTIGSAGLTLSGGGQVALDNSTHNTIAGTGTFTNEDNLIDGAGDLGGGTLALVNDAKGVIEGQLAAGLTIDTGASTIMNAGVIESQGAGTVTVKSAIDNTGLLAADGGTLSVQGAVSGAGQAIIGAGGTAQFQSSFSQNVSFRAATGELILADSQGFAAKVFGFSTGGGTSLDLRDIGFVGKNEASFSGNVHGGVLTVTDGTYTARIILQGDYLASTFTAASDSHDGVIVTDPTTHAAGGLAQAMAAMAPAAAAHEAGLAASPAALHAAPLARPWVQMA